MIQGLDVESKVMRCSTCSREIRSKYVRIDEYNKILCDKCYETGTLCQICFIPSSESYIVYGIRACKSCYTKRHNCLSCRRDILGEESKYIFGLQGFFCISCYTEGRKCVRCSYPGVYADVLKEVDKGLELCVRCYGQSVLTNDIAHNVLTNIEVILKGKFGIETKDFGLEVVINLVDKENLASILNVRDKGRYKKRASSLDVSGSFCVYTISKDKTYVIYSLVGLHIRSFISHITYEYAKILSREFCPDDINANVRGGFVSFISIKLLWLLGYHTEIERICNEYNAYSSNLRKLNFIEKAEGIKGVLEYVKST